ncbi:hypothetical protein [Paenibacillus eucommiae]|uniref:3-methyladenine DNA glycosylase n=1 Tax=Paenibacillus eucommiae TaxID=1355755 RepID=A0ABS4ITK4_9BACL|nr:hypothetical protein [Paenibacillus eucommiae]MBP1989909.1 hypothetical protein [Paenibacillus eucommiae]
MKNQSIEQQNESFKKQSEEAQKSKSSTLPPSDKKLHQPNRPSV